MKKKKKRTHLSSFTISHFSFFPLRRYEKRQINDNGYLHIRFSYISISYRGGSLQKRGEEGEIAEGNNTILLEQV